MEGHSSTGQSPQRAVAPMEEEEEYVHLLIWWYRRSKTQDCTCTRLYVL